MARVQRLMDQYGAAHPEDMAAYRTLAMSQRAKRKAAQMLGTGDAQQQDGDGDEQAGPAGTS